MAGGMPKKRLGSAKVLGEGLFVLGAFGQLGFGMNPLHPNAPQSAWTTLLTVGHGDGVATASDVQNGCHLHVSFGFKGFSDAIFK